MALRRAGTVAGEADATQGAATLRLLHQAFRDYDGDLPPYTDTLDRCWTTLVGLEGSSTLGREDRDLLMAHYCRLRREVEAAAGERRPIHGDVHLGNLLVGNHGLAWTDLEDACLGSLEQDIAGLPEAVWAQFPDAVSHLIARWADLKSVCVAVWCRVDLSRGAEIQEAAEYHLERVRRLAM